MPAAQIGSGTTVIVHSELDPAFALIDAQVDIGRMRQVGDALEADLAWTLRLGALADARAAHPGLDLPDGSRSVSRERVVCRADGALSYAVEARLVAPDGRLLDRRVLDAVATRREAERQAGSRGGPASLGSSYGPDPQSLLCWAAARRCEGRDFTWPPPPNLTPLEHSPRATAMRKAYAVRFVPTCRLPPRVAGRAADDSRDDVPTRPSTNDSGRDPAASNRRKDIP